jgi:hypothetical protein
MSTVSPTGTNGLTIDVIRARRPDSVVRSIQRHSVVWGTRPGDILEVPDDGHHLLICVRGREDHGVGAGEVAIVATVGC